VDLIKKRVEGRGKHKAKDDFLVPRAAQMVRQEGSGGDMKFPPREKREKSFNKKREWEDNCFE